MRDLSSSTRSVLRKISHPSAADRVRENIDSRAWEARSGDAMLRSRRLGRGGTLGLGEEVR
jgi:hypothetical protein